MPTSHGTTPIRFARRSPRIEAIYSHPVHNCSWSHPVISLVVPLRGVRTIAPRGPGAEGAAQPRRIAMPQTYRPCPAETGHTSRNRPAPKGQNRLAQGTATRRSRGAPPWVNGQPHTSVALKGRDKLATNASQTRQTERRNDPNTNVTRDMADSFCPSNPANRGHPFTSGSQLFVITSRDRSCRAPSGL
jgi:hypothetical protein